jgi:hypothetical protein
MPTSSALPSSKLAVKYNYIKYLQRQIKSSFLYKFILHIIHRKIQCLPLPPFLPLTGHPPGLKVNKGNYGGALFWAISTLSIFLVLSKTLPSNQLIAPSAPSVES